MLVLMYVVYLALGNGIYECSNLASLNGTIGGLWCSLGIGLIVAD